MQPTAQRQTGSGPERPGGQADEQRLAADHLPDLPPGRGHRAQHGDLPLPLLDRQAERADHDQQRHQQGGAAQHGAHADQAHLGVGGVRELHPPAVLAGADHGGRAGGRTGEQRPDVGGGRRGGREDPDSAHQALVTGQLAGPVGAEEDRGLAVEALRGDADHPDRQRPRGRPDGRAGAGRQVRAGRGAGVDDDLVRGSGRAAGREGQPGQRRGLPTVAPGTGVGPAGQQRREGHLGGDALHRRQGGDAFGEVRRHPGPAGVRLGLLLGLPLALVDQDVHLRVAGDDDRRSRVPLRPDRTGQSGDQQRAAAADQGGGAEQRDEGPDEPGPAVPQGGEGESQHHRFHAPRRIMRSATLAAVGPDMVSATRPSARNSTSSA